MLSDRNIQVYSYALMSETHMQRQSTQFNSLVFAMSLLYLC